MIIASTIFQQYKRRIYIWKKPEDTASYQINYLITKQHFKNQIKQCKTYSGADINSDHNLIIMETQLIYKKTEKLELLKNGTLRL